MTDAHNTITDFSTLWSSDDLQVLVDSYYYDVFHVQLEAMLDQFLVDNVSSLPGGYNYSSSFAIETATPILLTSQPPMFSLSNSNNNNNNNNNIIIPSHAYINNKCYFMNSNNIYYQSNHLSSMTRSDIVLDSSLSSASSYLSSLHNLSTSSTETAESPLSVEAHNDNNNFLPCTTTITEASNLSPPQQTAITSKSATSCTICNWTFTRPQDLRRHLQTTKGHAKGRKRTFFCELCGRSFSRADAVTRHRRRAKSCNKTWQPLFTK